MNKEELLRKAHYLRMLRTALDEAERPKDREMAWAALRAACNMLAVINDDQVGETAYVVALNDVWDRHYANKPVGVTGAKTFRAWADAFDADLADELYRLG